MRIRPMGGFYQVPQKCRISVRMMNPQLSTFRSGALRFRWLAIPLVLAVYFTLITTSNGVPALRHDWNWPDYYWPFLNAISGWSEQGIGSAGPFVNNYVLVVLLAPIGAVIGPYPTLFAFEFAIGLATLLAARRLAITVGCEEIAANAAAAFALFNPWVYTKVVAGHLPMIVAYAATMALLSEAMREKPRPEICALAVAFTLPQLQFFLPALLVAIALVFRERMWLPVATWAVMGAPILLGVIFRAKEFGATPVTLTWEQTQSVAPVSALLLSGYFAKYTLGFDKLGVIAISLVVAVALAGLVLAWRSRRIVAVGAATAFMLVAAMGLRGPAAGAFAGALTNVPALGLYRELYDLIAYVAIGYLVLCAVAATRHVVLLSMLCAAALILIAGWTAFSPARQWANRGTLPAIPSLAPPLTRFALMPPFQPLRYGDRFAGLDPDSSVRAESVVSINEEVPAWPEDVALARYQRTKDWRPLANLSVSEISNRPWYSSASRELSEQLALAPLQATSDWERHPFSVTIPALPEVSLIPTPSAQSIPSDPGAGDVFFGDVAGLRGEGVPVEWGGFERPRTVVPGNRFVHATDGWVDARLGFAADPELGQPFGGALTTSSSELLTLSGGRFGARVRAGCTAHRRREYADGEHRRIPLDSYPIGCRARSLSRFVRCGARRQSAVRPAASRRGGALYPGPCQTIRTVAATNGGGRRPARCIEV